MLLIDSLAEPVHAHDLPFEQRDTLVLTSEQRRWARGRFTTAQGREIALALPTGTVLEPGRILWVEQDWHLAVEAAPEPLLAASPGDAQSALRTAFEVGNRHFPLAIDREKLFVPDDPAMEQLLNRLGVPWERVSAVFQPIGHGHRHEH